MLRNKNWWYVILMTLHNYKPVYGRSCSDVFIIDEDATLNNDHTRRKLVDPDANINSSSNEDGDSDDPPQGKNSLVIREHSLDLCIELASDHIDIDNVKISSFHIYIGPFKAIDSILNDRS